MKRSIVTFLVFAGLVTSVLAQDRFFSVVISRGSNMLVRGVAHEKILMGTVVRESDQVSVDQNGYVALLHPSGGFVELQQAGRYDYRVLESRMQSRKSSVLAKYCNFLIEKIYPVQNDVQHLNVTGAVERGEEQVIRLHLPNASDLYGARAHFSWDRSKSTERYEVTVKNMFDEVIAVREVRTPHLELDFAENVFSGETLFIINVRDVDNPRIRSRDYGIKRLSGMEAEAVRRDLEPVLQTVIEGTALGDLLIASFFEERRLLIDASTCYKKAIDISAFPKNYEQLYAMYLRRNRLNQ
jgi:hypothetical protein